jgi:Peptidase propeptide and YPEB domain
VGLNKAENVVAFGANFNNANSFQGSKWPRSNVSNDQLFSDQVAAPTPVLSKEDAIASAEQQLGGTPNNKVPTLEYYSLPNGDMVLTYVVEVQTASGDHWYEAFVDATTGEIRGANDFVAAASYNAVDPTVSDVTKGYKNFVDPADIGPSPKGWHTGGWRTSTDTSGEYGCTVRALDIHDLDPRQQCYRLQGPPRRPPRYHQAKCRWTGIQLFLRYFRWSHNRTEH